ncbi:thiamine diphosphokinase [Jannaschia ovalis]|uniref:Thiamine diphosphokinase n=1 Tax=Jannaschia ovalis TaxID=3038773 RepID=A0ABY8LHQ4_9RHOB|nr:thiamine diphosphokinase [Jannaschia sp. GRR-S6-38]WGH79724.1 thiamine diphosphokinase [Jannaschia sp. GRR-S6-38]
MGGAPASTRVLETALTYAPRLVAVDSGADAILRAGLWPERVVGDMDSISEAARAAFADRLEPIAEQDSTDFAKALRTGSADFTLGVGFVGARADHFLACLSEMGRRREPILLLSDAEAICVAPDRMALAPAPGTRLSLWPMGAGRGRSEGLRWPLDGIAFDPAGRVGTSNQVTGPVRLALEGGPWVLTVPLDALAVLLEALEIAPRRAAPPPL